MSTPGPSWDGPPNPSSPGVGGAWRGVMGMPRWALFLTVAVIAGVVYYYYVHRANSTSTTGTDGNGQSDWENSARQLLLTRGYPQSQVDSALNHYLHNGSMSPEDITLIAVAVRVLGTPDVPNPQPANNPPNPWNNPGPGTPSATSTSGLGSTTASTSATTDPTTFWYVTSTGIGWTSTFNGIAQQFYGSSSLAPTLLQTNPGLTSSVYSKIPAGARVKVPRTVPQ